MAEHALSARMIALARKPRYPAALRSCCCALGGRKRHLAKPVWRSCA
jgi:hypothetical protein